MWSLALGAPHRLPAQLPAAGAELSVYLLTMGQGDMVWEKFGHNALWIHDPVRGTDQVYNYGVFDFHSPGYWGRFVRGTWIYQIDAADIHQTTRQYEYLNRTLVAQELNLTPAQKVELQAFLEWNLRPENREYRYDYFRDNCSTRIRDALDRVLDGQLRRTTETVPSGATYRWHSRRLIADDVLAYGGMNTGLGPEADREISAWEEMFIPAKVHYWAGRMRVAGPERGFRPLVRSERVLYRAMGRREERTDPPGWLPGFFAIGITVGGLLALLAHWATRATGRFVFSLIAASWMLVVGIGGILLAALWGLTDHQVAYRNENLLQLNPLAILLIPLLPALAYGARWAARPAVWLVGLLAGGSVIGSIGQLLPGVDQANGEAIALALPAHLGLALATYLLAKRGRAGPPMMTAPDPRRVRRSATSRRG